ncbi:flagellar basal body L-ring protein FlgH [bacterium]|nr:flagellar basal body L-ring protein FlgH [bacterium]
MRTQQSTRKNVPPRSGAEGLPRMAATLMLLMLALGLSAARLAAQMEFRSDVASLFTDDRLYKKGDVLTIIIDERVQGVNNARFRSQRGTSTSANFGAGATKVFGMLNPFSGSVASQNDFDSRVQNNKTSTFTAEIAARVVKTDDLGNLYLEGSKVVNMPDENRVIAISGIARSQDVTAQNTINSSQIADLQVTLKGKGEAEEMRRPTIFNRILGWFF